MNADGTPAFDANGPVALAAANLQSRIIPAKGTSFVNTGNKRLIRSDKDRGLFTMTVRARPERSGTSTQVPSGRLSLTMTNARELQ